MNQWDFIKELHLETGPTKSLSQYIYRVERGETAVLRSAIGKSLDARTILSGWDRIFNAKLNSMTDELLALEFQNRSKFSPRSLALSWEDRSQGVYDYFRSSGSQNVPDVGNVYQLPRLRPLELDIALSYLKNNTNSGLPFITRKSNCKDLIIPNFRSLLDRKDPCVMFTRTQEDYKTRTVWGYPIVDTLNEMRFYRPLLSHQRAKAWRSALVSPEAVDNRISALIRKANSENLELASLDFSSYDASVKIGLQRCAFDYIKSLYQTKYHPELDYIFKRFNTIGLITPSGILSGPHGVPSGSTFTNEVDSIVQYLCAKDYGLSDDNMDVQGDDGVYAVDNARALFDHFSSFGLSVNKSKSYIAKDYVVYLQRLHSTHYSINGTFAGVYPTYRALGRIVYPERYDQYSECGIEGRDFNSIRAISILENCSHHPLFEELVQYIAKLDKYQLAYSQQGLKKYINRFTESHGVEGIFRYRYGDNLSGLNSFKTVKILSEL